MDCKFVSELPQVLEFNWRAVTAICPPSSLADLELGQPLLTAATYINTQLIKVWEAGIYLMLCEVGDR